MRGGGLLLYAPLSCGRKSFRIVGFCKCKLGCGVNSDFVYVYAHRSDNREQDHVFALFELYVAFTLAEVVIASRIHERRVRGRRQDTRQCDFRVVVGYFNDFTEREVYFFHGESPGLLV